ncbi:MAG TPA: YdcF family protein [Rhodospirillaceae bacterium]|nr:YdcF family protein [Rhodospirillaceae bacterium]
MRRRRPSFPFFSWAAMAFLAALVWLGGLIWFATTVPQQVEDVATITDAIVVLTGGSERLDTGLSLLRQRLGAKLFVSGVYRGLDVNELLRLSRQKPDEVECCIVLGYAADNTQGNANETAAWIHNQGFHSLRLVTANYHMRRSLLEFHFAMPDVTIIPHPVFPDTVKQGQWWMWPGTAHLLASEYDKFLAAQIRHLLENPEDPS